MNFREYANTETSAFIERLIAAADAATQNAIHEVRTSADAEIERLRPTPTGFDRTLSNCARNSTPKPRARRRRWRSSMRRPAKRRTPGRPTKRSCRTSSQSLNPLAPKRRDMPIASPSSRGCFRKHRPTRFAHGLQTEMSTQRAQRQEPSALLSESIDAFDALATATTLDELFTKLVQQMAAQFPRVVIFRRKGQRLEGDLGTGLEESVDLADFTIAMSADSIITTAATQGVYESATAEQLADSHRLPGEVPSFAVAAPLVFQGETLAVVYADTRQHDKGEAHAAFAGVLAAHTNVLLSRLTQELKIARELREYAQMLLHEAEEMFVADTKEGRSESDRLRRLRDTIDFGRQLYAQRAALEGPGAAGLLEEEIASLVHTAPTRAFTTALADALAEMPLAR